MSENQWTRERIMSDPRFANASPDQKARLLARAVDSPPQMKEALLGTVKKAVSEATFQPGSLSLDLLHDPVTQAKALPPIAGAVGAISPVPMGSTMGTVAGRQISNKALKAYGKESEIPSDLAQVAEGALSVVGDVFPFPAMNRLQFGKQVGQAEKAAGIPEFPPSMKRPTGPDSTAKFIDWARQIKGNPGGETLKQIKDQIDFIYKNRKNVPISDIDEGKLKWLGQMIQSKLNKLAPGRAAPAKALSMSQTVPRTIVDTYMALPKGVRNGIEFATAPTLLGAALFKALGSNERR